MTEEPLNRLAIRASSDPFFLGFRLAEYSAVEELDDAGLARKLGCDQTTLTQLRLCRAPRTDSPTAFREDVECIATKFGLNSITLADVAKVVLATASRGEVRADVPGVLLAARDRSEAS